MAHQAHSIPWGTLACNLEYLHCSPRNHGITNLYLRKREDVRQVKELRYFVRGFVRALEKYSAVERRKFEAEPSMPEEDDMVVSEAAVKKMARTVLGYKMEGWQGTDDSIAMSVSNSIDDILSPYERSPKRFIRDTDAHEGDMYDGAREACEQTKAMLMHGDMDGLLKLAAHPGVRFYRLWHEDDYANAHGFGLYKIVRAALAAYLCLNVMFLKPELYDEESRQGLQFEGKLRSRTGHEQLRKVYDYRLTAAYQHMLLECTGMPYGYQCDAHTYPHLEFFGIPRGWFRNEYHDTAYGQWQKQHLGTQGPEALGPAAEERVHIPSKHEMPIVLGLLSKKGLPTELGLRVMEMAEYRARGRLLVRDDPLHGKNAEELAKYLGYCWRLLVRVDMMCQAGVHGQKKDWEAEVTNMVWRLFDMPGRTVFASERPAGGQWGSGWRSTRKVFREAGAGAAREGAGEAERGR